MRYLGLCERAQSKCAWTCHQSHLMREFTGKMPRPRSATPILCEPAQSKCTWTCHKSHLMPKFTGNMPHYAIETRMDMSQEPFYAKIIWKMPNANTATPVLCQPAQSKCTWTFHKSHFVRNLKGKCRKMPNANTATPVLREPAQSKCTWTCHKSHVVEIYRENAGRDGYHLD